MSRRFIAGVLAAALTITAFAAAPARAADRDDIARFVGAATTLFILGKIIEQERRDDRAGAVVHRPSPPRHEPRYEPRHEPRPHHNAFQGGHGGPRHMAPLPARCLRDSPVAGTRYVMGVACLRQNYRGVDRLPAACRLEGYVGGRWREGYSVRCLRGRGYTIG